ncbi:MAG TPA: hypothetical protein PKJ45_06000 [Rubrivivax sp.]|nr:hypothetical protein [Rubrivivax sp.]
MSLDDNLRRHHTPLHPAPASDLPWLEDAGTMQRTHVQSPKVVSQVAPTALPASHPAHDLLADSSKSIEFLTQGHSADLHSHPELEGSQAATSVPVLMGAHLHSYVASRTLPTPSQSASYTEVDEGDTRESRYQRHDRFARRQAELHRVTVQPCSSVRLGLVERPLRTP